MRKFSSDNTSGAAPAVLAAMAAAGAGDAAPYGADDCTGDVAARLRATFGGAPEVHFVSTGTAANVLCLAAVLLPGDAVLCARGAHLAQDECGAPERFLGVPLWPLATVEGKLTPDVVAASARMETGRHRSRPRVLSISQATEWGTVYSPDEIAALAAVAHAAGLYLHVDGARLANAAAALDLPLAAFGEGSGIDLLSFGGTKNGAVGAEAVLLYRREPALDLGRIVKQSMQLSSKMRFLAAQFGALLEGETWRQHAQQANRMAARLAAGLAELPGLGVEVPVESNAVFLRLPAAAMDGVVRRIGVPAWETGGDLIRLMCSFDTHPADVDELVAEIRAALAET